ncbi:SGNH/GDSL hydrolase family protein, partial [Novosphingobium sp. ZW T3_23]|uniref:SGNH/GDSL hydrolase family protein n=1 Tax=Novosphingobium sp. ZW T3_23 TaxID=3378084 RepID=UPI00385270D6
MKRFTSTAIVAAVLISNGQAQAKAQASAPPAAPAQAPLPETGQSAVVDESLAGQRYVAIGSSFAAGPMLPPAKSGAPARCGQSMNNYPTLLAERFGMILTDRTCSGATTNNVLGPWGEIAPQINAVTPQTRLVTVTIGGNDLNYIGNLFTATCLYRASQLPPGSKRAACGAVKVPTEVDYARDEMQMMEIARRIRTVAPRTRLVFVQYLTPLPQPGSLCAATPVSEEHAAT